jgi:hypothetical protein
MGILDDLFPLKVDDINAIEDVGRVLMKLNIQNDWFFNDFNIRHQLVSACSMDASLFANGLCVSAPCTYTGIGNQPRSSSRHVAPLSIIS